MSDREIAVIGMAGRFPGAATVDAFWANLRDGVESIRALSDEELLAAGVSAEALADPGYVKMCPVLDDVDQFDAAFFGFSPRDAEVMDPAHRLFLEVAWEALEHAGRTGLPDEDVVGVFAGSGAPYYLMDHVRKNAGLMRSMGEFLVRHTNNDMNFLSSRVSYEMDLRGPSINIQTACSTALVSVHMACESIRRGECSIALAGGSTVLIPDRVGYQYHEGEILSPDGHCRPFDEKSAGTVFGSGSGCLVLKRLSAALDDGDTIHAVIKGSAVNNDGALRVGFLAPGVEGQAAVVGRALDDAGVSADSISYIETHGTGTSVGDPIEVAALNQAFATRTDRRRFCAIGSVKSNIGHLGEAAGVASLIKAIEALKHRQLPPSLGFERPNPQIEFEESPFFVNDRLREWTADGPRRCGVTALGAGGTNCHIVLEEAPAPLAGEGARAVQLLSLSAATAGAVDAARQRLADALEDQPTLDLADVAYTLSIGRRALPFRYAVAVRDRAHATALLREPLGSAASTPVAEGPRRVVFLFPGGGAQYPGMGADLYATEPVFRDETDACLRIVNAALGRDLGALMFAAGSARAGAAVELERPSLTLPALFTAEYALARLFLSWGVEPQAMLGHSMGEYVAACLAGTMSLADALRMVMLRGKLFEMTTRGAMLSVPLAEAALREFMSPVLSIAAVNAAELCVASGPVEAIDALAAQLAARDIDSTRIRIEVAAHSALLDPVLAEFGRFCRTIDLRPPTIPFLSNVTGDWITVSQATDPEYWVTHLRSTVRFADCLETVRAQGEPVLLEIGPGRTLSMLARAQTTPATHAYNSMRHPDESTSDVAFALSTVGKVWAAGVPVDWSALYDGQLRNRVPLPTYAWDHERFWVDAPTPSSTPAPTTATATSSHRPQVSDWFERPVWHQTLPVAPATLLTNVDAESEASRRRVLLFTDSSALAEQFEQCLVEAGCDITRVHRGAGFKQDAQTFTIRPAESDDYDRLLKAVTRDGAVPGRIVHMWSVTDATQPVTFDAILEQGFHSLHAFGRALANENPDAAFTLYAVTSDLQRVGGESSLEPTKALLLGPARVMPREFPNVRTRAIDVVMSAAMSPVRLAAQLAADVLSDSTADTIALRGADRYEQRREPVRLDPISPRLRERGVYLITGGLGGLGLTVAEHLARTRQARLVLVGRRAPGARTRVHLASLAAMGAEVEFVQADLRDADQARTAVERARARFGALHGVFHTAGTLNDSLFAFKTRADAEGVLAPKVQGTLALDAALGEAPLDLFVLFSSISSIAGLAGQADYTAANAFLDAFAHARSARDGSCVVAVNWSAWRDVGMAARLAGAADGGTGEEEVHPVLGRRLFAGGDTELFGAELSTASHWVVNEHRLRGGPSLMPGTGHLELVCAAAQSRPASGVLEIRDLNFMSPLLMPEDGAREMRVQVAAMADGQRAIAIGGRSETADGTGVWREHVTATAAYRDLSAPVALDVSAIAGRCTARMETFAPDQESVNMAFGPRWKNLQSIRYGQGEALVTLELPQEFLADLDAYTLHPALMDMATGRCEALAAGFNPATDFYVPLSYTRVRVYAPLTARLFSHVRVAESDFDPREFLVFNATIADAQGRVLAEVDEFVMTRVTDKTQLNDQVARGEARRAHARFEVPAAAAAAPPMVQRLEVGIRPDEGMQALEYILAGPALPQLFATPEPVDALVAALRRPPERAVAMVDETVAPPIQPKVEVEAALMAHEAVREVAVLERMNRQGTAKLVAYPVFATGTRATGSDLRRFLKSRVPSHLVPSTYVDLDGLPRTADGAVDYAALPDPFGVVDQHVAPRTATEALMAEIWKEVLGVSRVGVHDNFFDAGGHSLLAVRVIIRLDKKIGVRLTQANMVLQTLEQLAADCDRRIAAAGNATAVAQ